MCYFDYSIPRIVLTILTLRRIHGDVEGHTMIYWAYNYIMGRIKIGPISKPGIF